MPRSLLTLPPAVFATALATAALAAPAPDASQWHAKARALLEHAVDIPTVQGRGKVPELAAYYADTLKAAGWTDADIHILPYEGAKGDATAAFIARWPAAKPSGRKPILLMAHMDVVEAKAADWSMDPFTFVEKDGYYYGRGTEDIKHGDVALIVALMQLRAQGFKPDRDLILFFTGDEETTGVGAKKGAAEWRKWTDAEYGLNSDGGGGGFTADGRPLGFSIQTAEKTYAQYMFTVRNKGGHSSRPRPDNAIYQLAHALTRLEAYRFKPALNETTRAYFQGRQAGETGPLGDAMRAWLKNPGDGKAADFIEASPTEVALTRTRCVATRLFGGHADNALPQLATASINCRILPGVSPDDTLAELKRIVADPQVEVTRLDDNPASLASPLRPDILAAYTAAIHKRHPDSPIIPEMSTGASDARPFRVAGMPVYGVDGGWGVIPEDERAHGRDERFPVKAMSEDVDHWVDLISTLAK